MKVLRIKFEGNYFDIQKDKITIGRDPTNDIVIEDKYMSRFHCIIIKEKDDFFINDLKSTNGTFINGVRINSLIKLKNNDIITFNLNREALLVELIEKPDNLEENLGKNSLKTGEKKDNFSNSGIDFYQKNEHLNKKEFDFYKEQKNNNEEDYNSVENKNYIFNLVIFSILFLLFLFSIGFIIQFTGSYPPKSEVIPSSIDIPEIPEEEKKEILEVRDLIKKILVRLGERENYITEDIITIIERYFYYYKNSSTYYTRMENRKKYIKDIERMLEKYNLQKEYSYIPFVESGYNINSYNRKSGAKGMYQFIRSTAIEYGLVVNKKIDQREDFLLSTQAFCKYIKDMASIFGYESFLLVCASYNSGDGTIRMALKKIDNVKEDRSFFYLYRKNLIPNETRDYVCKIVAAIVLTEYLNFINKFKD